MFSPDQYELLDFGAGRKLERFGEFILDRPSPAAEAFSPRHPALWKTARHRYDRAASRWSFHVDRGQSTTQLSPPTWNVYHDDVMFVLRPFESGQIGLFPEQAANWGWITDHISSAGRALKVLNLFAYTGGSTQAAAAAGAEVVHIDAAEAFVKHARMNAVPPLPGEQRRIRWITEDATKFVERELRRGNAYDAVILDPPSYGHGPNGEAWKLEADLPPLLENCARLTAGRRAFILLTCHTPGFATRELAALLAAAIGPGRITSGELTLDTRDGRSLPSGHFARWLP